MGANVTRIHFKFLEENKKVISTTIFRSGHKKTRRSGFF